MALIWQESFELGYYNWDATGGSLALQSSGGRTGTYWLGCGNSGTNFTKIFSSSYSELYLQYGFLNSSWPYASGSVFNWMNSGGNVIGSINIMSNHIVAYLGNAAVIGMTGNTTLQANTWYCLEMHIKIDNSVGVIEWRLDGVLDGQYTGNTNYSSYGSINRLWWGINGGGGGWDDLVVYDTTGTTCNSWTNCLKLVALAPTSDGATHQWTPTPGGSHYTTVDEVPANTTDYISGMSGQEDFFGLAALPSAATYISFVQPVIYCKKNSLNYANKLSAGVLVSGVTTYTSPQTLYMAFTDVYCPAWTLNPNTQVAWTRTDVTNLLLGIKPSS